VSNFVSGLAATPGGGGYWVVRQVGAVDHHGAAGDHGDAAGLPGSAPVVGIAPTSSGNGYWLAATDGGVFTYGDASFFGSAVSPCAPGSACPAPNCPAGDAHPDPRCSTGGTAIVGIAAAPDGGYWLAAGNGGVLAFGPAPDYPAGPMVPPHTGCTEAEDANACHWGRAVVGISASSTNVATVAADGEVRARGPNAYATAVNVMMIAPATGVAMTPDGSGAWVVGRDGGVFALNAPFYGSAVPLRPAAAMVGIVATPTGHGYWLVGADGGVFTFGDARFFGASVGQGLGSPSA